MKIAFYVILSVFEVAVNANGKYLENLKIVKYNEHFF